ncbi:MAG TPA: hypothetical protein VFS40_06760 [Gemmatimonadales bacterium]|nr:hypothetical protein [Gemmatimonadales bacterium]
MRLRPSHPPTLVVAFVAGTALGLGACNRSEPQRGNALACGLAAAAAPQALLNEFGVENQTLGYVPAHLPQRLVVRFAGGPALPAVVGRADSALVLGVEGTPPANQQVGFGVLVVDRADTARGAMLFPGLPPEGAPQLGTVSVGGATVPLIGVQTDPKKVEDPKCPLFPDSVAKS